MQQHAVAITEMHPLPVIPKGKVLLVGEPSDARTRLPASAQPFAAGRA